MIKVVVFSVLEKLKIDIEEKVEYQLKVNDNNLGYPVMKISNDRKIINEILDGNFGFEELVGQMEYKKLTQDIERVFAYTEREFNSKQDTEIENHINLCFDILNTFCNYLWLEKDNSVNFSKLYIVRQVGENFYTNFLDVKFFYSDCKREIKKTLFSGKEIQRTLEFFKDINFTENKNSDTMSIKGYKKHAIAYNFIRIARVQDDLGMKISNYCSALESLFSHDSSELTYKLSERVAVFLEEDKEKRIECFKNVKDLYKIRSSVVHGSFIGVKSLKELRKYARIADDVCRKVMKIALDDDDKKNVFIKEDDELDDYFLDLIME